MLEINDAKESFRSTLKIKINPQQSKDDAKENNPGLFFSVKLLINTGLNTKERKQLTDFLLTLPTINTTEELIVAALEQNTYYKSDATILLRDIALEIAGITDEIINRQTYLYASYEEMYRPNNYLPLSHKDKTVKEHVIELIAEKLMMQEEGAITDFIATLTEIAMQPSNTNHKLDYPLLTFA